MKPSRKHLAVVAVAASAVVGTAGIAAAAAVGSTNTTTTPATTPTTTPVTTTAPATSETKANADTDSNESDHVAEEALTGETATKVTDAALAAVPGGTVVEVETDTNDGGAYEAHMTDANGAPVNVILDANFKVIDTLTGQAGGRGGHGGHGEGGQRSDETPLTGETATKVTEAAQTAVPGGTVERVETDADSDAPYEAHVTDASGNRVTVTFDQSYKVVETTTGGPDGHGGRGGHGGKHGHDDAADTDAADTAAAADTTTG